MIYVLQLENGKFYVGYTERENGERFIEHFSDEGAEWTKKYKPIQVLEFREGTKDDENIVTLELMRELGWFNVRGGKWCKVNMTHPPEELVAHIPINVKNALKTAMSKITSTKYLSTQQISNTGESNKFMTEIIKQKPKQKPKSKQTVKSDNCYRCGRAGHWEADCYASKDINGNHLSDIDTNDTNDDIICSRCYREGHLASKCYAKTNADGGYI